MQTIIRKIEHDEIETARLAACIWKEGGLVAFPTETVYGLGGDGMNAAAAGKIYAAKDRPCNNPLILHITERNQLDKIVREVNPWAKALMDVFWPGPLTLILPKTDAVPYETTGGLETVAVRMPSHPAAVSLLKAAGIPIAAPSANRSGRPSPTNAEHVAQDMDGRIDMIVDGGDVGIGIESTIVDVTGERPMLLRPGFITVEMLEAIVGPIDIDPVVLEQASATVRPKAPGMNYRHYAPNAGMLLVEGSREDVAAWINARVAEAGGKKIGVLATDENLMLYQGGCVVSVGSTAKPQTIAHNLFRVLRDFDDMQVDYIYSESFSADGAGLAIMNRLLKAAGHQIINVSDK